jgi:hypothetical protein
VSCYEPTIDVHGVRWCSEICPQYDGKRCEVLGFVPDRICEPWARSAALAMELQDGAMRVDSVEWCDGFTTIRVHGNIGPVGAGDKIIYLPAQEPIT